MKQCYKCKSTTELSIKYRTKNTVGYMCRTCRRLAHKERPPIYKDPQEKKRILWAINWSMLAEEINGRVVRHRAQV